MARNPKQQPRELDMNELKAYLDRHADSYIVRDLTDNSYIDKNKDALVGLASVTKPLTAAVIMHAKGNEFLDDAPGDDPRTKREKAGNRRQMTHFLSRSDNSMGERLALRAFGSQAGYYTALKDFADSQGLTSLKLDPIYGIESHTTRYNNDADNNHLYLSLKDATTGLNATDGKGPMASADDVTKVLAYLANGDKAKGGKFDGKDGDFLNDYASPESGVGHTMGGYAFDQKGLDVYGAKSGTNPRAGDITGAVVFKNEKNGHVYAAFAHMPSTGARPAIIQAMEKIGLKAWGEKFASLVKRDPAPPVPPEGIPTTAVADNNKTEATKTASAEEPGAFRKFFGDLFKWGANQEKNPPVPPGSIPDTRVAAAKPVTPLPAARPKEASIVVANRLPDPGAVVKTVSGDPSKPAEKIAAVKPEPLPGPRQPVKLREVVEKALPLATASAGDGKASPRREPERPVAASRAAKGADPKLEESQIAAAKPDAKRAAEKNMPPDEIAKAVRKTGLSAFVFGRVQQEMMGVLGEKKSYASKENLDKVRAAMKASVGDAGDDTALANAFGDKVEAFQRTAGLTPDKILGKNTAHKAVVVANAQRHKILAENSAPSPFQTRV